MAKSKSNNAGNRLNVKLLIGVGILFLGAIFLSTNAGKEFLGFDPDATGSSANQGKFRKNPNKITGSYIVVLEDNERDVPGKALGLSNQYRGKSKQVYESAVKGFSVEMSEADALALSEDPNVAYVEEDGEVWYEAVQSNPYWALDRIDQRNLPYDLAYNYNATGQGVNVYIIDTGIMTTHEDFGGRAFIGTSTVGGSYDMTSCNGHGTAVAGIVGGATVGVAKQAKLYSVRVFPCTGYANMSDVIAGVDWVTRHATKPAVANMSLGSNFSSTLNSAVNKSVQSGITYAVASGNNGADACSYSPGSANSALTTGATGNNDGGPNNDVEKTWSNYGRCVDILSPGQGVRTVWNGTTNNIYTYFSGTSAASPYTAGVAALYLEGHPSASATEVNNALVQNATPGVLTLLHSSTPNLLLYSLVGSGPGDPPQEPTDDNIPPVVTFSTPSNGTVVRRGNLKIGVTAQDTSGISEIVISLDNSVIKTCYDLSACNASISANSLSSGTHQISATATDKAATPNTGSAAVSISK